MLGERLIGARIVDRSVRADVLHLSSLSRLVFLEKQADRGKRGLRRRRGTRWPRCRECNGKHNSYVESCRGGILRSGTNLTKAPKKVYNVRSLQFKL